MARSSTAGPSSQQDLGSARRVGLERDDMAAAALELVRAEGAGALTMRRLAQELGVSTPTIYWHAGSRDELIAEIMRAEARRLGQLEIVGATPHERVMCAVAHLWESAVDNRAITALAHQTGTTQLLRHELEAALLAELEAAGLSGERAAQALHTILFTITGFLVHALRDAQAMPDDCRPSQIWANGSSPMQPTTRLALRRPADSTALFQAAIERTVAGFVAP